MKPSSFARLSGVSLMVSAVLEMALGVIAATVPVVLSPSAPSSLELVLWSSLAAVSRALALIGIIGLARGGAAGNSALGKIGFGLAVLGLALNVPIIASGAVKVTLLAQLLDGVTATLYALGLTLVGMAVLLAHRWQGWHRFMPLLLGLYILLVVDPLRRHQPGRARPLSRVGFSSARLDRGRPRRSCCWLLARPCLPEQLP
jgi:hypothetical protein